MKTQYYTATSLDGFIATPDDSLEWLFPLGDLASTGYPEFMRDVGALAMGSHTYEWMLRHLIQPKGRAPQPWPYELPTWIFTSRSLPTVAGADLRFVRGDVRPVHAEMASAAKGKNIWLVGGGDLVGQFYDHGLLDEIIAQVGSVTLGAGKPILPRNITNPSLRLTSARAIGAGFAELRYIVPARVPAGDVVRPAREEEVEQLADIWYEGWQDAHAAIVPAELGKLRTRESFQQRLRAALTDVRVVGPLQHPLGFCMTKGDELYQLYVARAGRGKQIAALLADDAVAIIRSRGAHTAWLGCAIGNERAARFYEKSGWRRAGTIVSQLETQAGLFPLEVWRYEKSLTD
ncbi:MAG: GNAT family N-acetyltransferase [Gemmatimonadaceae bacterium]